MHRLLNRELSWLQFNDRVLSLSTERGIPLLERAKFCAIASSNLDEFFQVRVAALKDQVAAGLDEPAVDGRSPSQQLAEIALAVQRFVARQESVFIDELRPELAAAGVAIVDWGELTSEEQARLGEFFEQRVLPVLTPLALDPGHPFPYISDLALSIAAMVADPETGERRFVRLKVPSVFPRLVAVGGHRFVPAEQLVAAHLHQLFVGMVVEGWSTFRVTRNGDLTLEEEDADDLLEAVEMELRRRRFNKAVRLEVDHRTTEEVLELLVRELDIDVDGVVRHRAMLDLTCLLGLLSIDRPDLRDRPWPPVTAGRLAVADEMDRPIFSVIRDRALLVHHPYESFTAVEQFIDQAADDPKVQSIKMTLYRAGGGESPILRALMRAAERGVQVAALVELKARFDEAANVRWARQLERAGVHVVYGMVGLKTHSKIVMVVRDDGDQLRRYCHIGTGNYNPRTSRIYEDLGFFTCDPDIGADAMQLFNHLTGYSRSQQYRSLVVAPRDLRPQLLDLIERETAQGARGRITIKCNSIVDRTTIDALYAASAAGVQIDLVVRGTCGLRAGVPGLSDNIRVRSVLGRYLEHSRIYRFEHGGGSADLGHGGGNADPGDGGGSADLGHGGGTADRDDAGGGAGEPLHLIGSADLMPRNLDRRVEVLVPIEHPKHREWLDAALGFALADDVVRWELRPDDTWERVGPTEVFAPDAQERMYRYATERQQATRR